MRFDTNYSVAVPKSEMPLKGFDEQLKTGALTSQDRELKREVTRK